ncbi:AAA family ATPase [Gordonia jinhuaensis]|uniref:DNA helicase n=1 Tax=Gordonia jinhuaensis TaxID=1517702 RepID=A0A916TGV3_9ACTN|nr:ATP-binding domain-containing protein [Gordonia jinhuaensis]GGB42621.1 DNA helicase [Gordonia jinhuaensis]
MTRTHNIDKAPSEAPSNTSVAASGRDASAPDGGTDERVAAEQTFLDGVYARLDRLRRNTQRRLASELREDGEDNPQLLSERESYERMYSEDLAKFDAAEHNLYFGRLDMDGGEVRRIGRIGILDDDEDDSTLLLDWRAPLSRPFYLATPAATEDVHRRRHVRTRSRRVRAVNDEMLDGTGADPTASGGDVVNESALIAALDAARTGEMTDIVETIQREQDVIIRSAHRGVTVVQGAPGTGKTAVALHRAAYLLYTHRDILSRSGVLIIGPNDTFLRYIGQVLPSLGETGVLLSTIGDLYPGVHGNRPEPRETAVVKGDLRMVDVLKRAVRERQTLPSTPITLTFDGYPLEIDRKVITHARGRARSSRRPHNRARPVFLDAAFDALAQQHAERIGSSLLDGSQLLSRTDIADIRDELAADESIRAALEEFWPHLTPASFLLDLYASRDHIDRAGGTILDRDEKSLLFADEFPTDTSQFTPADAPLLDEVAEIIGYDEPDESERERDEWRQRLSEAQDALDILTGSAPQDLEDELDPEILMAYDLIDAEQLASRQTQRERLTTAERAQTDRTWTFGHVIVDEAQELSPMAWRMLMRRTPNRWMTIIGDTAQTSDLAGTRDWGEVLSPYVAQRWRHHELTVNYRTPREIMDVATGVLAEIDPDRTPPTSLRSSGRSPVSVRVDADDVVDEALRRAHATESDGLTAVIVPDELYTRFAVAVGDPDDDRAVHLTTVSDAKGLEFDETVVVEPTAIVAQSPRGLSDLYVALTRATQQLSVVYSEDLPAAMAQHLES